MKKKLSVIVAAYNLENYIEKCLDSLVNQTYKDMEIIVIDDGSIDNTAIKIKTYKKIYNNLIYIKKKNGGLSSARNLGLDCATGEYITFVDGDDYLELTTYDIVMRKIIKEASDLCIFSFNKIFSNRIKKISLNKDLYDKNFLKKIFAQSDEATIVVWNKIFKRELIEKYKLRFENKAFFEDTGFILRYLYLVKKISIEESQLYNYVQRASSITNKFNSLIFDSKNNTVKLIEEFYKENKEYEKYKQAIKDMELRMNIYILNKCLENNIDYNLSILWKEIFYTQVPAKHRILLVLNKIKAYKVIYKMIKYMK